MNIFLKVFLILVAVVVAVKLLPLAAVVGVGLGLLGVFALVALAVTALLSPIWLPVLALGGLVMIVRRSVRAGA